MLGLEKVYQRRHEKRGHGVAVSKQERGAFLRKHVGTEKRVLDVGCRDGALTETYMQGNTVTGADIDSQALKRAHKNLGIEVLHLDLNDKWNIEPKTYDVVVACEFLEHIYFPDVVCQKVKRVLKDDGLFVGTVPHAYSLQSRIKFLLGTKRGTPLEDPTHINHFSVKEFVSILEREFQIVALESRVPPRYKIFSKLFPFLFADNILFVAKKSL